MEVLTGMSNVHSLGDMSTNSSTVVERHISWPLSMFTTTRAAIKLQDSREGSLSSLVAAKGSESAYRLQQ